MSEFAIFSGSANLPLAEKIAHQLNTPLSESFTKSFSDGNLYVKLNNIHPHTNLVIQSLGLPAVNQHLLELLFMLDALKRANSQNNLLLLPYFSYAKADKLEESGTSLRSQVCANCLQAAGASNIITLDLHSERVSSYFTIPLINLSPCQFFTGQLKKYLPTDNLVVVSPDRGYQKRAREYAKLLACNYSCGKKIRKDHQENIAQITINDNLSGKNVLVVDDFTTSGNTLLFLIKLLKQKGVKDIYLAITHCLASPANLTKILSAPIKKFFTSNSLANPALAKKHYKLHCFSVASLFAQAIREQLN